jgi:hypothetical protein
VVYLGCVAARALLSFAVGPPLEADVQGRGVSTGGDGGRVPLTFLAGGRKGICPPLFDHKMKKLPVVMNKIT